MQARASPMLTGLLGHGDGSQGARGGPLKELGFLRV